MRFSGWRCALVIAATLLSGTARAEVYELPPDGYDVIGVISTVRSRAEETLLDLARRHGLGYEDIVRANPEVDAWLPGEGTEILLPTQFVLPPGKRHGIVLNLAEYRMYYYPEKRPGSPALVMTWPMSIGRMDWATPLGQTRITVKAKNPSWYPPESVRAEHLADGDPLPRIVPPGPENPLGAHAMRLDIPGYLIHGTNRPAGVGMRVTHGCIRMFPEDIEFLFDQVAVNTPVRIINEPVKIGWNGDELVLEVHRTLEVVAPPESADENAVAESTQATTTVTNPPELQAPVKDALTSLTEQFVVATSSRPGELDWDQAEIALQHANGVPAPIGRSIKNAATSAASY
ncbi:MAG: L,D-transpeptidase family protein [Gammaproteobacteria bacterium]|nr:L,D-transpeptidase family protein [Gammaproteobacteria bacterium]MDH4315444.1 L,D-transpeptidase family protein [Gammaproteobacteria bacterium]